MSGKVTYKTCTLQAMEGTTENGCPSKAGRDVGRGNSDKGGCRQRFFVAPGKVKAGAGEDLSGCAFCG